jgi:hypothetical protein
LLLKHRNMHLFQIGLHLHLLVNKAATLCLLYLDASNLHACCSLCPAAAVILQAGSSGVAGAKKLAQAMTALQRQLAGMLAVPLQPSFSTKYFTGGISRPAAAAAAAAGPASGSTAANGGSSGVGKEGGDGAAAAGGELKLHSVLTAQSISDTLQLAARLQHSKGGKVDAAGGSGSSLAGLQRGGKGAAAAAGVWDDGSKARRKAAAEAAAVAARGGVLLPQKKVKKGGRKGGGAAGAMSGKPTGLARLLMSKNELKRQKKQQGMFVVRPGTAAFGRDALGVSALEVLSAAAAAKQ